MEILVDIRELSPAEMTGIAGCMPADYKFVLTAWQWSCWKRMGKCDSDNRLVVVVPDFLYYARLASTGQAAKIARLPASLLDIVWSGVASAPSLLKQMPSLAKGEFWAGAFALLAYDLGLLKGFRGEVILHSNLSDFLWLFDRWDFLERYAKLASAKRPGIATQQLAMGLSCCSRWKILPERFIYPKSADGKETALIDFARDHEFGKCVFTADVTLWPAEVVTSLLGNSTLADGSWIVTQKAGSLLSKV